MVIVFFFYPSGHSANFYLYQIGLHFYKIHKWKGTLICICHLKILVSIIIYSEKIQFFLKETHLMLGSMLQVDCQMNRVDSFQFKSCRGNVKYELDKTLYNWLLKNFNSS